MSTLVRLRRLRTFKNSYLKNAALVTCTAVRGAWYEQYLSAIPVKSAVIEKIEMAGNMAYTIVEYFGGDEGHRCGYCKNEKSNFSHGKWIINKTRSLAGIAN